MQRNTECSLQKFAGLEQPGRVTGAPHFVLNDGSNYEIKLVNRSLFLCFCQVLAATIRKV